MSAFVAAVGPVADLSLFPSAETANLPPSNEGHESWSSGGFSFVRSLFASCPEHQESQIPPHAGLVCVADARLDHRDELMGHLRSYPSGVRVSDAHLIALAYRQWGDAAPDRLRGDFAFVIWDPATRILFGASDPFGVRTLRYHFDTNRLWVGSRTGAVASGLRTPAAPNVPLLRAYLRSNFAGWASQTAFEGVARLPPGHSLTLRDSQVFISRYCRIGDAAGEVLRTDDDYVARYRELLDRSVRSRLRAIGPVAVTLSGGLDSSAIAGLTARVARQTGAPLVRSYSFVFPGTPTADESVYQQHVLAAYPEIVSTVIPADDLWSYKGTFDVPAMGEDEPNLWATQRPLFDPLASRAAADGARVLLMGNFSDEVLGARAGRQLLVPTPPWQWGEEVLRMVAVRGVVSALREAAGSLRLRYAPPDTRLQGLGPMTRASLGSFGADRAYRALFNGRNILRLAWLASFGDRARLEVRFPFLDRDLVEFCLTLPEALLLRGDRVSHKYVLREAMNGTLPPALLDRRGLTNFSHLHTLGLNREKQAMLQVARDGFAVTRGWLPGAGGVVCCFCTRRLESGLIPRCGCSCRPQR